MPKIVLSDKFSQSKVFDRYIRPNDSYSPLLDYHIIKLLKRYKHLSIDLVMCAEDFTHYELPFLDDYETFQLHNT